MNKLKAVVISILFLTLLLLLYFIGPFLIWGLFDSSWYQSEEVDLGPLDYNSILMKAEKAGYEVEGSWPWPGNFSGFEPGYVPEIRESLGSAVLVREVRLNYEGYSELTVFRHEGGSGTGAGACVALSNLSHSDPESSLQLSEFPEDAWLLEKFGLLFGLDEKAAEKYLETLKKAAQNQSWDAEIKVNESLDFPAVYANLRENSDESGYDSYMPDSNAYLSGGSHSKEYFLKNGGRLGSIRYFVPKARVMTFDRRTNTHSNSGPQEKSGSKS